MRTFSLILIALGIYLLVATTYDEIRGSTIRPFAYLPFTKDAIWDNRHSAYQFQIHYTRAGNPAVFHKFIAYHWLYAVGIEIGGCVLLLRSGAE